MSNTYYAVCFVLLVFVLCIVSCVHNVAISLDCTFLIASSDSLTFIYIQNTFYVFPRKFQHGTGTMFSISITTLTSDRKCP